MSRAILTLFLLAAVALAGCSDDSGGDEALTAADCEADGLVLGEVEHRDNETGEHHTEPACVEPGPPATVTLSGLPASVAAYTPVQFQWVLGTGQNESHAMRTEVRVATESTSADDRTRPDDWGDSVALKEHQNFVDGQSYEAAFTPTVPGDYHFRGYALVSQVNVWSEEYVLNVTAPAPTGTTHEVEVSGGGLPEVGGIDPEDLTITLGDAVAWSSGDGVDSYTIESTGGPASFSATSGGGSVTFLVPGTYSYTAAGTLSTATGTYSGSITVQVPTA